MTGPSLNRAAELRRTFDRTFAEPLVEAREEMEALLAVRVATVGYALRLAELAGIFVGRLIVPVPSAVPALLGLAGIRGAVTPVYCLHLLLGHPQPPESPRWIVLAREELVGFAFDQLDGHRSVLPSEVTSLDGEARGPVRGIVQVSATTYPVVSIHSAVATIKSQLGLAEGIEER